MPPSAGSRLWRPGRSGLRPGRSCLRLDSPGVGRRGFGFRSSLGRGFGGYFRRDFSGGFGRSFGRYGRRRAFGDRLDFLGLLHAAAGRPLDDTGPLAGAAAQIIELGPADLAAADNLDRFDARAVERKDALDALAVRQLAHGEGRVEAGIAPRDAHALERLDPLAVALDDPDVDPHGVAGAEIRDRLVAGNPGEMFLLDFLDDVHGPTRLSPVAARRIGPTGRADASG